MASHLESAYKSSCLAHLGNISYLEGAEANGKATAKVAGEDSLLEEAHGRFHAQLEEWSVDQSRELWKIGGELKFDASDEKFVGGKGYRQANKFLKRKYRQDYEVPAKV